MSIESKRFPLSRSPLSQERLAAVRHAYEHVHHEHPEVLSLTLFGSLVKGATKETSDIDANIYIDADRVAQDHKEEVLVDRKLDRDIQETFQEDRLSAVSHRWKVFRSDIAAKYISFIRTQLQKELPALTDRQVRDVFAWPVNEAILAAATDDMVASFREYPQGIDTSDIHLVPFSEGEAAREYTADARVEPSGPFFGIFLLSVGNDLRPYRAFVIERLSREGEIGEKVWSNIVKYVEAWEQGKEFYELPTEKHYPRTLADAQRVYG